MLNRNRHEFEQGMQQVDYVDLTKMHRATRKFRDEKWIPEWAADDKKVRLIVYKMTYDFVCAHRIVKNKLYPGISMSELDKLANEAINEWPIVTGPADRRQMMKQKMLETGSHYASRLVRIIYMAYRQRLRSTDIAETLQLTPVCVREILYRMNLKARKLFPADKQIAKHHSWRGGLFKKRTRSANQKSYRARAKYEAPPLIQEIALFYNSGATQLELAKVYGIHHGSIYSYLKKFRLISSSRKRRNRGRFIKGYSRVKLCDL